MADGPTMYGLVAEFKGPGELAHAARAARQEGYTRLDAYSPFPVEELNDALGLKPSRLPLVVLIGGLVGCVGGFFMQYYASAISYPLNVGGRPLNSWPSFIPVTFEVTVLLASFAAMFAWIGLNGLPQPYHPVFNVPRFATHASEDGFFLTIEATDPKFDRTQTRDFLRGLGAKAINEVEP
jgi:hypothetical protein